MRYWIRGYQTEPITILPAKSASNLFWVWYCCGIESEPSPLRREAQSDPA